MSCAALVREGMARDEAAGRLIASVRRAFRNADVTDYERGVREALAALAINVRGFIALMNADHEHG